jgi:hypothetical protein
VTALVAVDLDQTLIYSEHSGGRSFGSSDVWVEDYDGRPLSFMTLAAHALLAELATRHHVMPVTTRTPEQLGRIRLPHAPRWALCANGGVLLVDGRRDVDWDARVREELAGVVPAHEVMGWLGELDTAAWVRTVRQVEDLFVYLVAHERDDIPAGWLSGLQARAAEAGWCVSRQGRKVYVTPGDLLCKGRAARALADRLGAPLLAAGDSALDRALLLAADAAIRPRHGELQLRGGLPGVPVTGCAGPEAAEEVLRYLLAQADALVPCVS